MEVSRSCEEDGSEDEGVGGAVRPVMALWGIAERAGMGCSATEWLVAGGVDRAVEMRLPNWVGSVRGRGRLFHIDRGGPGTPLRGTSSRRGASVWKEPVWGEEMWSLGGGDTCSPL